MLTSGEAKMLLSVVDKLAVPLKDATRWMEIRHKLRVVAGVDLDFGEVDHGSISDQSKQVKEEF